jgi:hypothetical protein
MSVFLIQSWKAIISLHFQFPYDLKYEFSSLSVQANEVYEKWMLWQFFSQYDYLNFKKLFKFWWNILSAAPGILLEWFRKTDSYLPTLQNCFPTFVFT